MNEVISLRKFSDINLDDSFFDSLKSDYPGFEEWFKRKASEGRKAYVQYVEDSLQAFLFLKNESGEPLNDIIPQRPACKRLKVGTFKIDAHNTRLGERFVKKIMDTALYMSAEEIYVTIFPKHEGLIQILKQYGFCDEGKKGDEIVFVKDMKHLSNDLLKNYPLLTTNGNRKFVLSIYPEYHTRMFPDSILNNENRYELIRDVSYTNSIHKIYLCSMYSASQLCRGDLVAIYRTTDWKGPAHYRSVITSVCQIEEVKVRSDFNSYEEFAKYTNHYSVFTNEEIRQKFDSPNCLVIKMTYNMALTKRVTKQFLVESLRVNPEYWGFFQLTEEQFDAILKKGEVDESIIIN